MSDDIVPGWPECKLIKSDLLDIVPPLACIKVHSVGLEWWLEHDLPETWEISCSSTWDTDGRHYIYEVGDLHIPLASLQDIIVDTVTRYFTGVPPVDEAKEWVRKVKPAKLTKFPEVPDTIKDIPILGTHTPQMAKYGTHLIN